MSSLRLSTMQKSLVAKKILLAGFLAIFLFLIWPNVGLAQDRFGLGAAGQIGLASTDLRVAIVRIIQILLSFLGIVAVIVILYGGYVWMTSGGDPAKIEKAKKILINAVIGIIIILSAYTITAFIIRSLLGAGGGGDDGGTCPGCSGDLGRWGIGAGPIQSVYPAPGQVDVPINTWLAVTFKEDVKPETICNDSNGDGACTNETMQNVEICKLLDNGSGCDEEPNTNEGFTTTYFNETKVTNTDKRTFVFTTAQNKYLGKDDRVERQFQVLLNEGIERVSDGESVLSVLPGRQYKWGFTTNGELDLDPPEIVSTNISGVYPNPDNLKDLYGLAGSPRSEQFTIIVADNNITSNVNSSYSQPAPDNGVSLSGAYNGSAGSNSPVRVTMSGGGDSVTTDWPGSMANYTSAYTGGQFLNIGPYGLIFKLNRLPSQAESWTFNVTASQLGDRIEILENKTVKETYVFGSDIVVSNVGADATLNNLVTKINTNSSIFKSCGSGCLETRQTGAAANRFSIRSLTGLENQNNAKVTVNKTQDGADPTPTRSIRGGQRDTPKNTIFQINFNEAINPVYLDSLVVKQGNDTLPQEEYVVEVSNQYKTIELRGPNECGVNNCGEKIFCWPVASEADEYEVSLGAASLMPATDARCAQWGGSASLDGRCYKTIDDKMVLYPAAAAPVNGFIDMSGNSFNGSFNFYSDSGKIVGIANGPKSTYDLNASNPKYNPSDPENAGFGDNFKWSFWLANEIDLQAPLINQLDTLGNNLKGDGQTTQYEEPVEIVFDRIMRSSTLKPGWNYGDKNDAKARSLRYLVLETLTLNRNPVGYWISKIDQDENNDTWPDKTAAYINHNIFDFPVAYGPLAGSGLQSITQNCFLPGAGPNEAAKSYQECAYNGDNLSDGCANVSLPNPASYGYLNCKDIKGADVCETNENCKVLYYDDDAAFVDGENPTDLDGSWVITKDYPRVAGTNRTGCCFGVCLSP